MILNVKVVPSAKRDVVKETSGPMKVYVTRPSADGKANQAMIRLLADKFNVSKSAIEIIRGEYSPRKTIKITGL